MNRDPCEGLKGFKKTACEIRRFVIMSAIMSIPLVMIESIAFIQECYREEIRSALRTHNNPECHRLLREEERNTGETYTTEEYDATKDYCPLLEQVIREEDMKRAIAHPTNNYNRDFLYNGGH